MQSEHLRVDNFIFNINIMENVFKDEILGIILSHIVLNIIIFILWWVFYIFSVLSIIWCIVSINGVLKVSKKHEESKGKWFLL